MCGGGGHGGLVAFGARVAAHEFDDGGAGGLAVVQDGVHLAHEGGGDTGGGG